MEESQCGGTLGSASGGTGQRKHCSLTARLISFPAFKGKLEASKTAGAPGCDVHKVDAADDVLGVDATQRNVVKVTHNLGEVILEQSNFLQSFPRHCHGA